MGKKTLYHPVSLYVIRGAFDQHGYVLGRIKQTFCSVERGTASYRIEITSWQGDKNIWSIGKWMRKIAEFLPAECRISNMMLGINKHPVIWLDCDLNRFENGTYIAGLERYDGVPKF